MDNNELIKLRFKQSIELKQSLLNNAHVLITIENIVEKICQCFRDGKKLWLCGNGGSASDAQHIAAEFSGRYYYDRPPLPAEALHVNTSYLTAVANDYGYNYIFSRLIEAQASKGDILIGLSTSGKSSNVLFAMKTAKEKGLITIAMLGAFAELFEPHSDIILSIPFNDTPRIQEAHMLIGHIICELVEKSLFPKFA